MFLIIELYNAELNRIHQKEQICIDVIVMFTNQTLTMLLVIQLIYFIHGIYFPFQLLTGTINIMLVCYSDVIFLFFKNEILIIKQFKRNVVFFVFNRTYAYGCLYRAITIINE